jgi:hypothetical protein
MLALFEPGGIDGYFRSMSNSPADLPSGAIAYSTADIEPVVRVLLTTEAASFLRIGLPCRCSHMPLLLKRKRTVAGW